MTLVFTLALLFSPSAYAQSNLLGDVNGDGLVNAVDVQLVINAALGLEIAPEYEPGINKDEAINAVDVQLVINAALGLEIGNPVPTLTGLSLNDVLDLLEASGIRVQNVIEQFSDFFTQGTVIGQSPEGGRTFGINLIVAGPGSGAPKVTTISQTSPANGDTGVALFRETIIRFSSPLDRDTVQENNFAAGFSGRALPRRLHVSDDGRTVTLFYTEVLPSSARVRVTINGEGLRDLEGNPVDVTGDGQPGGIRTFNFDTISLNTVAGTALVGRVFASELAQSKSGHDINVPLEGVLITVDGAEDQFWAVTDADGNYRMDPAPVGRFFIHIDGRPVTQAIINGVLTQTTYPEGPYFPFVGKPAQTFAGMEYNKANIYLPLIRENSLTPVSETEDTTIGFPPAVLDQFPEFADVSITVPANSLMADDGTRGGRVGIAPVPPDRIPSELPTGIDFPLVITVQTDGPTNFDTPVPACFPNLPDPVTGILLPPGSKTALWGFNHDSGEWEVNGSMTVSADGTLVCTDPDGGIRAPGWWGTNPSTTCPKCCPTCCRPGPLNRLTLVRDFLDAILSCTKDAVSEVGSQVRCMVRVVASVASLLNNAQQLSQALNNSNTTAGSVAASLEAIIQRKNDIASIISDCGLSPANLAGPTIQKAKAVIDCLSAILELANNICGQVTGGPGEGCQAGTLTTLICTNVERAHPIIRILQSWIAQAEALANQWVWQALCAQIDKLQAMLALTKSLDPNAPLPEELREALLQELALAISLAEEIVGLEEDLQDFGESFDEIESLLEEFDSLAAQVDAESIVDLQENAYAFVVDVEDFSFRGQSNSAGLADFTLPANTPYEILVHPAGTSLLAVGSGVSNAAGTRTELNIDQWFHFDDLLDSDDDGLPDLAEHVYGTNPNNPDTSGDGILDGDAVRLGIDPLGGFIARTGIVASADTPGTAIDVDAIDERMVVADGDAGVALFNVFNGLDPTILAQVDTPGFAMAVALSGNHIVAADGESGAALIDISDPVAADIQTYFPATLFGGGRVQAATASGGLAFLGSTSGTVAMVIPEQGVVFSLLELPGAVYDLTLADRYLYAYTPGQVHVIEYLDGQLRILGSVTSPEPTGEGAFGPEARGRIFVGNGLAYPTHRRGYNVVDVSNPSAPILLVAASNDQNGWFQVAVDGTQRGVAAMGPLGRPFGFSQNNVSLYDFRNPTVVGDDAFLTMFETPGRAFAVTLYNGLAYVADDSAGIQVVNYEAFDNRGIPPVGELFTDAEDGEAEEGSFVLLTADVTDDVNVRNVTFFANGEPLAIDGDFPYELLFRVPNTPGETIELTAIASDTGGNRTNLGPVLLTVLEDTTPPVITVQSVTNHLGQTPVLAGDVLQLNMSIGDFSGVTGEVRFWINGERVEPRDSLSLAQWFFDTPLTPATLNIRVEATDGAGNTAIVDLDPIEIRGEALTRMISVYNDQTVFESLDSEAISRMVSAYRGEAGLRETGQGIVADIRLLRGLGIEAVAFLLNGVPVDALELEPGLWALDLANLPESIRTEITFASGDVAALMLEPDGTGSEAISRMVSAYRGDVDVRNTADGVLVDIRLFRNLPTDEVRFLVGGLPVPATELEPGLWELDIDSLPESIVVELDFGGGAVAELFIAGTGVVTDAISRQISAYNFAIVPEISGSDFLFDLRPFARFGITEVKAFVDGAEVEPLEARPGVWGIERPGYRPFTLRIETTLENGATAVTEWSDADITGEIITREAIVENLAE